VTEPQTEAQELPVHDARMQEVLGLLSSHPKGIRWRARISLALAALLTGWLTYQLVPLLSFHHMKGVIGSLVPGALFEKLLRSGSALPREIHSIADAVSQATAARWSVGELWVWFAAAVLTGALVAIGLSDRWAAFQSKRSELRGSTLGETTPFPLALALAVVVLLFALPVAAYVLRWLPTQWEILADGALVTMLWSLLAWAGLRGRAGPKRRLPLLLGAAALWAVPLYNSVLGFFSKGLGSVVFGTFGKVALPTVTMAPMLHWGLVAAGLVSFVTWLLWRKRPKAKEAPPSAPPEPVDHQSLVAGILGALNNEHVVLEPLRPMTAAETSPVASDPGFWRLFMNGLAPTNDQLAFLEKHRAGSLELVRRVGENLEQSDWWNGFNLLLVGPAGSGRTTALIAAALYSATAGGATALLLAPRSDKRRWLCARVRDTLRSSGLHTHFDCEELSAAGIRAIVEGDRPMPAVLVATPQDLEDHLFAVGRYAEDPAAASSANKAAERNLRLDALLSAMHAVFVENVDDFDPVTRSHLAFQLEKLRLRLAAHGRSMTAAVAAPTLDADGAALLGARLFGETGFRPDLGVARLRPASVGTSCLAVEIGSSTPAELAEEITEALLRKNLATILYRNGLDEEACSGEQRKIAAAAGSGRLLVIGDMDQQTDGGRAFDAIVYQNLTTLDATLAIGLRYGGETVVIFHIRPSETARLVEPRDGAIPVMAGRESRPLVMHHSLSFWSGLELRDNIEKEWMKRLAADVGALPGPQPRAQPLVELRESRAAPGTSGRDLLALVRSAPTASRSVPTAAVPDDDLAPSAHLTDEGARISLEKRAPAQRATRLHWISAMGQTLATRTVANSPLLMLRGEDGNFSVGSLQPNGDGDIKVVARFYAGTGKDLVLPAVDLAWQVPEDATLEMVGGGADFGARCYRVMRAGSPADLELRGTLRGVVSEEGLLSSNDPIPFAFPASFALMILERGGTPAQEPPVAAFGGDWSTSTTAPRRHHFEATRALTAFLCEELNGPAHFSWPIVFEHEGHTLVWLIEPTSTGTSVSAMVFSMLSVADFRHRLGQVFDGSAPGALRMPPARWIGSA
jgi:hypothetical protein